MPTEEIEHGTVTCVAGPTSIEIKVRREWLSSGTVVGPHGVPDHVAVLDVEGKYFTCRLELDAVRVAALVKKLQDALADLDPGPPPESRKR